MILDIDIGNSRIKWRVGDEIADCDHTELEQSLDHWRDLGSITMARLASVAGSELEQGVVQGCHDRLGVAVEKARVVQGWRGLNVAYEQPESLGVDRWLAMLAVRAEAPAAFMVVDAGSALTVDVVDREGAHLGGFIVPGWATAGEGLFSRAQHLRLSSLEPDAHWRAGNNTLDCIQSGFSALYQSYVTALYRHYTSVLNEPPRLVLTGGDGMRLQTLLSDKLPSEFKPNLVLQGLPLALP